MKNLVIVESPAKAQTIAKFLGKDFIVLSSVGHIRNIAKKSRDNQKPVDPSDNYKTTYEIDIDKTKIISKLKKAVKNADTIWLATDEDREGEAIAWHLCEVLNLDIAKTKRIVFHEITKEAISKAIENPRTIDMDLVKAQQARQTLDWLVGFELSPVVWRKVPGGKSAGRVQSPAVRLLVEREREIENFAGSSTFKITAEFLHGKDIVKAELDKKFDTEQSAQKFLESLIGANFSVSDITTSPGMRNPGAPFTTSTLQQEANSRLSFSAKATMSSAQRLYQAGNITYMRTDSITLSNQALSSIANYIESELGPEYSLVRNFKTKNANAQEAHEAIRPTNIKATKVSGNVYDQKLYDLIRRRTLASQMSPAKLEKTVITIDTNLSDGQVDKLHFIAKGEVILFDGFLKVYNTSKKDLANLPKLQVNDKLTLDFALARESFTRPPARYTEGSLVKKLEELGIGRPSTYATIINTVQVRGYVEKGEGEGQARSIKLLKFDGKKITTSSDEEKTGADKGKLVPTTIGEVMSDFLVKHFEQIVNYKFTASVETGFDKISSGKLNRNDVLDEFYVPFHKLVEQSDKIDRREVAKSRELGTDPKSGQIILARLGRFGPLFQLGNSDGDSKPQFAPLPSGKKLDNVTLEDALKAFTLPRLVGQTKDGQDIKVSIGRFGPYVQAGSLYASIKSPLDPYTITPEQALKLYEEKLKAEREKNVADFGDGIKVLRGRFGPYVTNGTKNVKIDKDIDPLSITHDQAKEMLAKAPVRKPRTYRKRTKKQTK